MAQGGEDFKRDFATQYHNLIKSARKNKNKNEEVSQAYLEEAEKLKQRYATRSPKLMKELKEWQCLRKVEEAIYAKFPYGPKPK